MPCSSKLTGTLHEPVFHRLREWSVHVDLGQGLQIIFQYKSLQLRLLAGDIYTNISTL